MKGTDVLVMDTPAMDRTPRVSRSLFKVILPGASFRTNDVSPFVRAELFLLDPWNCELWYLALPVLGYYEMDKALDILDQCIRKFERNLV